jgi:hypothetical protein
LAVRRLLQRERHYRLLDLRIRTILQIRLLREISASAVSPPVS